MEPTFVRLTVQDGWSGLEALGFRLLVDGRPVEVGGAGVHDFLVTPGRHELGFSVWWLRRYGHASIDVELGPGQALEVFYAPPYGAFGKGSAGLRPQKRRGMAGLVAYAGGLYLTIWLVTVLVIR